MWYLQLLGSGTDRTKLEYFLKQAQAIRNKRVGPGCGTIISIAHLEVKKKGIIVKTENKEDSEDPHVKQEKTPSDSDSKNKEVEKAPEKSIPGEGPSTRMKHHHNNKSAKKKMEETPNKVTKKITKTSEDTKDLVWKAIAPHADNTLIDIDAKPVGK